VVAQPQHNVARPAANVPLQRTPHVHQQQPLPGPAATALHSRPAPVSAPAVLGHAPLTAPGADPFASGMFADLVQNEMVAMLDQMYAEMGVHNPMPLAQLRAANPGLYDQIRVKAEERASAILAQRQLSSSPQNGAGGYNVRGQGGYGPVASPQAAYPAGAQRKRQAEHPSQQQQQQWGPPAQYPRQDQPATQYSSRFNTATHNAGPSAYVAPEGGAYPREQVYQRSSNGMSAEEQEAARLAAEHRREEEARYYEELRVKYAPDHFVNGFLSEAPVVIDVARAQALAEILRSQYTSTGSLIDSKNNDNVGNLTVGDAAPLAGDGVRVKIEDGGDVSGAASSHVAHSVPEAKPVMQLSEGFMATARTLTRRLDAYLRDIQVPPRLPPVLFGPLPLVPVYGQSAEALDELDRQRARDSAAAARVMQSRGPAPVKVAAKLPVPPFR
jgi:hypothetical protein